MITDRMGPELRVMKSVLLQQAVLGVRVSQEACGHAGAFGVQVVVPAARANGPATDDGQYYDATQVN